MTRPGEVRERDGGRTPTRVAAGFVGCKVSQADGEEALAALAAAGLEPVTSREVADVVVVHTCCVTAEAERKSRRLVRRAASAGRRVVVAGCAAALHPEQFEAEGVTVAAQPDWAELGSELAGGGAAAGGEGAPADGPGRRESVPASEPGAPDARREATHAEEAPRATPGARTRLVLKVQDGCAGACTYCVVRLVRGVPRSTPLEAALAAARAGLERGCGEVVLSGIDLGAWRDGEARLPELVAAVAELDGLRRVRLSSVEPRHVTPSLLELFAHPRVARHLHVPLQSADDGVLRAMKRPYTFEKYLRSVEGLRDAPGGAMLSTDVIVGFPSEDEAAFGARRRRSRAGFSGARTCSRTLRGRGRRRRSCRSCRPVWSRSAWGARWRPPRRPPWARAAPRSAARPRCSSRSGATASGGGTVRSTSATRCADPPGAASWSRRWPTSSPATG